MAIPHLIFSSPSLKFRCRGCFRCCSTHQAKPYPSLIGSAQTFSLLLINFFCSFESLLHALFELRINRTQQCHATTSTWTSNRQIMPPVVFTQMHIWVGLQGRFFFANLFRPGRTAPSARQPPPAEGPNGGGVPENHVCIHPGCENFNWPNEVLLADHIKKEHIETHVATEWTTTATPSLGSDQGSQASQTPYASSTTTVTETPVDNDNFVHWTPGAPSDSKSSPSTPPAKPFSCSHEGCPSSFDRGSDLNRHLKIHQNGPREFDCQADGCKRKGNNGFMRLDKLREHVANRHPLSDFNIYIKGYFRFGGILYSGHRFLCWRKARQDWQAENPSDEMPPWLRDSNPSLVSCPKCRHFFLSSSHFVHLKDHLQTEHSSVEMPLWMSIEKVPEWYFVYGL